MFLKEKQLFLTNTFLLTHVGESEGSFNKSEQTDEKCWLNAWATENEPFSIVLLTLIRVYKVVSDVLSMVWILFLSCARDYLKFSISGHSFTYISQLSVPFPVNRILRLSESGPCIVSQIWFRFPRMLSSLVEDLADQFLLKSPSRISSFVQLIEYIVETMQLKRINRCRGRPIHVPNSYILILMENYLQTKYKLRLAHVPWTP